MVHEPRAIADGRYSTARPFAFGFGQDLGLRQHQSNMIFLDSRSDVHHYAPYSGYVIIRYGGVEDPSFLSLATSKGRLDILVSAVLP